MVFLVRWMCGNTCVVGSGFVILAEGVCVWCLLEIRGRNLDELYKMILYDIVFTFLADNLNLIRFFGWKPFFWSFRNHPIKTQLTEERREQYYSVLVEY